MNSTPRFKLFLMMVLEIFIWGAWLPLIFGYLPSLGFSATEPPQILAPFLSSILSKDWLWIVSEQSLILNAFPVSAIIGMFFSNQFADRNFAAEKFLSFSHLVGGLAMIGLAFVKAPEAVAGQPAPAAPFWIFFALMLLHCLFYVPTMSITNSIAFAHMKDAKQEFGIVRMGGTIGWILAAWPMTFILVDWAKVDAAHASGIVAWIGAVLASGLTGDALKHATAYTFLVSGIASLVLAAFSLALPHTPPKPADGKRESLAWLEAARLLKHPFVLVLWIVTLIDAFVHNSYFNWTGVFLGTKPDAGGVGIASNWIMPVMSVGQVAEILTMFILGATLKRLGWRATMIVGILGHAARFAVYAYFPQHRELIIAVQILHGICYAFFFATVYIFVDEFFPKDVRSSAQGLFNVMVLGFGPLLSNTICPWLLQKKFKTGDVIDFHGLFLVPCFAALVAVVLLAVAFHPNKAAVSET